MAIEQLLTHVYAPIMFLGMAIAIICMVVGGLLEWRDFERVSGVFIVGGFIILFTTGLFQLGFLLLVMAPSVW